MIGRTPYNLRITETNVQSPVPSQRIVGLDLARALAVIGMVVVNFKVVMASEPSPVWLDRLTGMLEGRAAALFVVLAGVGVALLTRRSRESGDPGLIAADRKTILKRALFLFVVGLAYTPAWPPDILHFYGAYLVIAALFITAPTDRLMWSAGVLATGFVAMLLVFNYESGWDWSTLTITDFWTPVGLIRHLFFNGFHPVFPWAAFMLIGMWLGRFDLADPGLRKRILAWAAGVAVTVEAVSVVAVRLLSVGLSGLDAEEVGHVFGTNPMPPMPQYVVAGAATAIVVIVLSVEVTDRYAGAWWSHPLVSTGQLALTIYVAHVVVGMGVLETAGRLYGQSLGFAVAAALAFSLAAILFAWAWRSRFSRGPLEWVIRKVTT